MASNTLTSSADGDVIPASDHNQLVNALLEEIVPRDATRAPVDEGGQLGTSLYRFLYAFVSQYFIGTAANNLRIYEGAANEIWIERGGTSNEIIKIKNGTIEFHKSGASVFTVGTSGITWSVQPDDSVLRRKIEEKDYQESTSITLTGSTSTINFPFKQNRRYAIAVLGGSVVDTSAPGSWQVDIKVNSSTIKSFTGYTSTGGDDDSCNFVGFYRHTSADATLSAGFTASTGTSVNSTFIHVWEL